tara:strand:- start:1262 stop:1408 length:147 start_codon:yes stop_codon:yes gene_type:complete
LLLERVGDCGYLRFDGVDAGLGLGHSKSITANAPVYALFSNEPLIFKI